MAISQHPGRGSWRGFVLGCGMAGLWGCIGLGAPTRMAPAGYNLVLINIDSLRADHLSFLGYHRATSPRLDRLAGAAVVYENAFANSSYTRTSVASLFTGRLASKVGIAGWASRPPAEVPTLAELLGANGYATAFFSNTTMLKDPGFTRGFETAAHLPAAWGISRAGGKLTKRASEFLKRHRQDRFFLYLHYLDPHGPYDPPEARYLAFADRRFDAPLSLYGEVRPRCEQLTEQGLGPGDPRFEDLVLRYDAEILDTDAAVGRLMDTLGALGLAERTLVVVTADHGEEFLEHGFVEHAWTLYRESLHIPLVLWAPSALTPRRVVARVSTVDLAPTLLRLLGFDAASIPFDGEPLLAYRDGQWIDRAPRKPFIAELLIAERNVLRSVSRNGYTYIAAQRWLEPGQRPEAIRREAEMQRSSRERSVPGWTATVREELYSDRSDPTQQRNLTGQSHRRLVTMRRLLERYRATCHSSSRALGPQEESVLPVAPQDRKRMRSLGYL